MLVAVEEGVRSTYQVYQYEHVIGAVYYGQLKGFVHCMVLAYLYVIGELIPGRYLLHTIRSWAHPLRADSIRSWMRPVAAFAFMSVTFHCCSLSFCLKISSSLRRWA